MNFAALYCALCLMASAGSGDVSNERPPVNRAGLEAHWGIDCRGARDGLRQLLTEYRKEIGAAGRSVEALDRLLPDLERCALLDRRAPVAGVSHQALHYASQRLREALADADPDDLEAALESARNLLPE